MKSQHRLLALILAIYLLLALAYGAINPLFEAPDEHYHFFTAQAIAGSKSLPSLATDPDPWMAQEAAQPPLYYVATAALIKTIDTSQSKELTWLNPRVRLGDASAPDNINAFVHTPVEAWPWQGHVLAVHLMRIFSSLLGLGTLLCIYGSGRLLWPNAPQQALLATAMVAFLPQFDFLHGSISNDTLIIFLCAAALWQLLGMWYGGLSLLRLAFLGITIGLAVLSKMAGLLLLIFALGFIVVLLWRNDRGREGPISIYGFLRLGTLVAIALLFSGWLLWRNWQLYGDITATNQFVRIAGGDREYSLFQVLGESSGLWSSFFALFGWFNLRPPGWVYLVWNGIVLAAGAGVLVELVRSIREKDGSPMTRQNKPSAANGSQKALRDWPGWPAALLSLWVLLVYAGLVRFMLQTPAAQGRLLFPALVPLALGLAFGLSRYRWTGIYILAPAMALLTSLYCLIFIIPGAYALPSTITEAEIPAEAVSIDVELGQGLRLVAAEVETLEAKPGNWVWLTLYWQAVQGLNGPPKDSPQYVLELFGRDIELIGKIQSYHGDGLYPASLWVADQIVADRLAVRLDDSLVAPTRARMIVKLVGEDISADVGTVKVVPESWPKPLESTLATLEGISLTDVVISPAKVQPGEEVTVKLLWQVESPPGRDLTTFVHLGDPTLPPLAQGDSPPLNGDYPTHLWSAGEVISDSYRLMVPTSLPPGQYPIHIGMYEPDSGARLPLFANETRQPNDAYLVGWLRVE